MSRRFLFLFGVVLSVGLISVLFLFTGFTTSPSWAEDPGAESYFSFFPKTVWIFQGPEHRYEKRQVLGIREVSFVMPGSASDAQPIALQFIEVGIQRLKGPGMFKKKSPLSSRLFYLSTNRGILLSPYLGENAQRFWQSAFLLFPREPFQKGWKPSRDFSWNSWVLGSQTQFSLHRGQKVQVPAGNYNDCARVSYRSETDGIRVGKIYFCPGIGETKIVEDETQLELFKFIPARKKGVLPPVLTQEQTQRIWSLLPSPLKVFPPVKKERKFFSGKFHFMLVLVGGIFIIFFGFIGFAVKRVRMDHIPKDPVVLAKALQMSQNDRSAGDLDSAAKRLEELLQEYPNYADLYYQLGLIREEKADFLAAIRYFRNAVRINTRYVEAQLHLAHLLRKKGELNQALSCYQVILDLCPHYADVHNDTGEILCELGEAAKGREHFERALAINPHFEHARRNLRELYGS